MKLEPLPDIDFNIRPGNTLAGFTTLDEVKKTLQGKLGFAFWTALGLETKLLDFQRYFNEHRTHSGLNGRTPETNADGHPLPARFGSYEWKQHCRGLYQTPMAA